MKKILFVALLLTSTFAANAQRFGAGISSDNSGAALNYSAVSVTPTGNDSINPNAFNTFYKIATLKAAETITIKSSNAKAWDKTVLFFTADTLTAGRVVTIASNTLSPVYLNTSGNTITVKKSKKLNIIFIFDGTAWYEESRSIQY